MHIQQLISGVGFSERPPPQKNTLPLTEIRQKYFLKIKTPKNTVSLDMIHLAKLK